VTLPYERLLRALGVPDHSLPDGCIEPTDVDGWCRFLVALHRSGWPMTLGDQAIDRLLEPGDLGLPDYRLTIKVWPGGGSVQINVFPGSFESIDFDFATREIVDQVAADALSDFIRLAGQAVGNAVALSLEGCLRNCSVTCGALRLPCGYERVGATRTDRNDHSA
jgi:hypothetical protein